MSFDPTRPDAGVRQFTVRADDDGVRVDRWFKRHLPQVGFATVSRWARTGQIRVDGKRVKPEDRLATGQTLRVPPGGDEAKGRAAPKRRALTPEEEAQAEAMLITRTRSALVLNKPPGLATQGGTKTSSHVDGLLDAYADEGEPRPRLVHRLDKDTSGVLLVARSPGSAAFYSKRFSGRSAKKVYWALVVGVPDVKQGTIDAPIAKQPGSGGEKMHVDVEGGQTARTLYRVVDKAGNSASWVELQPLTGRTHQLRVHMAAIGHPIVGDGKYGGPDAFLTGSISRKMHLHARRLVIEEPDGETLDVSADLPEHFAASMVQLGFDEHASDAEPDKGRPPLTKEDRKQVAKAHAKQYRKGRRGERKGRAEGGSRTGKAPVGVKDDRKAPATRAPAKGAGPRGGAKAGPKAGPAKPAARKPAAARPPAAKPRTGPRKPR
ncbi:RluA family pseudouridine synthase [Alteraurantiacibacter buctensis]|uniref:RNA pseudouridine synthase n=1 Tax=Alteraurantiacibacter buctensis TaxID=1503981 RepID=A0A844YZS7_9SPHN|nr:RluA family pseudouridine synthase [Alteraurantiacibacter buctensis]MXO72712.1 RNA pseudouridine synthase [Alteraurantiacibacter buctensis]